MPLEGLREQKKERTRLRLIDEAFAMFEKKGYDATTVEEIAAAADVTSRTFFRYFTSKEDLAFMGQDDENRQVSELLKSRPKGQPMLDFLVSATRQILTRSQPTLERARRSRKLMASTPALRNRDRGILADIEERLVRGLTAPRASKSEVLRIRILVAAYLAVTSTVMNAYLDGELSGDPLNRLDDAVKMLRDGFGA